MATDPRLRMTHQARREGAGVPSEPLEYERPENTLAGAHLPPADTPTREAHVAFGIERYSQELERFGDALDRLEAKLEPVLVPADPEPGDVLANGEARPVSELAAGLFDRARHLSVLVDRLNTLTHRLDI